MLSCERPCTKACPSKAYSAPLQHVLMCSGINTHPAFPLSSWQRLTSLGRCCTGSSHTTKKRSPAHYLRLQRISSKGMPSSTAISSLLPLYSGSLPPLHFVTSPTAEVNGPLRAPPYLRRDSHAKRHKAASLPYPTKKKPEPAFTDSGRS